MKVFLGGTTNGSDWRNSFITKLKIDYYSPVDECYTLENSVTEQQEQNKCDYSLYVVTPKMKNLLHIPQIIDYSNKKTKKTLFCYLDKDGDEVHNKHQTKSLAAVGKMVEKNGGQWFKNLDEAIEFLNNC